MQKLVGSEKQTFSAVLCSFDMKIPPSSGEAVQADRSPSSRRGRRPTCGNLLLTLLKAADSSCIQMSQTLKGSQLGLFFFSFIYFTYVVCHLHLQTCYNFIFK